MFRRRLILWHLRYDTIDMEVGVPFGFRLPGHPLGSCVWRLSLCISSFGFGWVNSQWHHSTEVSRLFIYLGRGPLPNGNQNKIYSMLQVPI